MQARRAPGQAKPPAPVRKAAAAAGLLVPLARQSEVRAVPVVSPGSFTPREVLLRGLVAPPSAHHVHDRDQRNMPSVAKARFEGGVILQANGSPVDMPSVNKARFEGGAVTSPSRESAHMPDISKPRFEGGAPDLNMPAISKPNFEGGLVSDESSVHTGPFDAAAWPPRAAAFDERKMQDYENRAFATAAPSTSHSRQPSPRPRDALDAATASLDQPPSHDVPSSLPPSSLLPEQPPPSYDEALTSSSPAAPTEIQAETFSPIPSPATPTPALTPDPTDEDEEAAAAQAAAEAQTAADQAAAETQAAAAQAAADQAATDRVAALDQEIAEMKLQKQTERDAVEAAQEKERAAAEIARLEEEALAVAEAEAEEERVRLIALEAKRVEAERLAVEQAAAEAAEAERLAEEAAAVAAAAEAEARATTERLAAEKAASDAEERALAELEVQLAEIETKRLADEAAALEAARLVEDARIRSEAERAARELLEQEERERLELERQDRELKMLETERLAELDRAHAILTTEQAAAEVELAKAIEEERVRVVKEAEQAQADLLNAKRFDFRAEAPPNCFVDLTLRARCSFDAKVFETSLLQQAFAIQGGGGNGGASNGSGGSLSLAPQLEVLALRSHKSMVSPPVWAQILKGEKEDALAKPGGKKTSENIVRIGDHVWLVAERLNPSFVRIHAPSSSSSSSSLEVEFADHLLSLARVCHGEYLRPVLLRLVARHGHLGSAAAPTLLAEAATHVRELEASVVGNKATNDPDGPPRTQEAPFDLVAPPPSSSASASSPAVLGSLVFTRAQELIHEPMPQLLEKMESEKAKRKKSGSSSSSGLLFPKSCKMQFAMHLGGLTSSDGPLHVFCVLYRAASSDVDPDGGDEERSSPLGSRASSPGPTTVAKLSRRGQSQRSLDLSSSSSITYGGRTWLELARTNLRSHDQSPLFERSTLELDALKGKLKSSVLIVVFSASYLGGSSGTAPPADVAPESIPLDRCIVLGGTTTSVQQLCMASGALATLNSSTAAPTPSASSSSAAAKAAASSKSKRKSRRATSDLDAATGLLTLDMDSLEGEVHLLRSGSIAPSGGAGLGSVSRGHSRTSSSSQLGSVRVVGAPIPLTRAATCSASLVVGASGVFSPSNQLEDAAKAVARRARKLAKLETQAKEAAEREQAHRPQLEQQLQEVRVDFAARRAQLHASTLAASVAAAAAARK